MRALLPQRLIALLLLVAYVITGTSTLPALVAFAAELEGSHAVQVGQSETGMRVVLHHRAAEFTPATQDHAAPLARLLVSFCQPAADGDHSLSTQRVTGSLLLARDETKREIKNTPALNWQATVAQVATQPSPAWQLRFVMLGVASHAGKVQQQSALATIRLLI